MRALHHKATETTYSRRTPSRHSWISPLRTTPSDQNQHPSCRGFPNSTLSDLILVNHSLSPSSLDPPHSCCPSSTPDMNPCDLRHVFSSRIPARSDLCLGRRPQVSVFQLASVLLSCILALEELWKYRLCVKFALVSRVNQFSLALEKFEFLNWNLAEELHV